MDGQSRLSIGGGSLVGLRSLADGKIRTGLPHGVVESRPIAKRARAHSTDARSR